MNVPKSHPAIKAYHAALAAYAAAGASHEGAVETAFGNLLRDTAAPLGWTLIPKKEMKAGVKKIIPDGTLQDGNFLFRGYWEAKDQDDDLDAEIVKKRKKGYPLDNTIFEDSERAVLYQNGKEAGRFDLTAAQGVADLLTAFLGHDRPDPKGFEAAVAEFGERVPELALGLHELLAEARVTNQPFREAFESFLNMCRLALNPDLQPEAVNEMLVQHMLTERLFRKLFGAVDFRTDNAVAAAVESVVRTLVSTSFSRDDFLRSLDKFFKPIEQKADTLPDFAAKQGLLNTVYERFFQGYSTATADTHGIVYTPQPVVDFMCASIEEVLAAEFGLTLGSEAVRVLDPCTGTGNFVVNLLHRVPKPALPRFYKEQVFANELMLLPYYIAALNVEHAYYELTGKAEPFDGLCFVDTLDLTQAKQKELPFFWERNVARVKRQREAPITVILGNPPYNANQESENDNNKNRKYDILDTRIRQTYVRDSKATLSNKLYDPYVRFFRWATDRLGKQPGIVAYVSNNSFVTKPMFDGMRRHLTQDFDLIYHFDCLGDAHTLGDERRRQGGNLFQDMIRVGVGITILVRLPERRPVTIRYYSVADAVRGDAKLADVSVRKTLTGVPWTELVPDTRHDWFPAESAGEYADHLPLGAKQTRSAAKASVPAIFKDYCLGASSNRDAVVYDFDRKRLGERVAIFCEDFNAEVDRYHRAGGKADLDGFLRTDKVKWSETLKRAVPGRRYLKYDPAHIRPALYRPFTVKQLYYADTAVDRPGRFDEYLPPADADNRVLVVSDVGWRASAPSVLCTRLVPDLHLCAASDGHQCFPFFVYGPDGERTENVTDWALAQFKKRYKGQKLTKWDLFHYVYAVLHHPDYRTRFADSLKKSLPRIPFAADFRAFATAGRKLADLHVGFETADPYSLVPVTNDRPLSYQVEKMALSKDKAAVVVNDSLTLAGLPPAALAYKLGNRSAVEWVIDQYKTATDKRSGVVSDPNRPADPRFVVDLLARVVTVSVETVRLVGGLPPLFADRATDTA